MKQKMKESNVVRLPLLKDNHTHAFTYASLYDSLCLTNIGSKDEAICNIKKLRDDDINIVLGWDNSKFAFEKSELANFPPVIICNLSLHNYIINPPAKEILKNSNAEIVNNIEDQEWVEKHLPHVINFVSGLKEINEEKFGRFFKSLENVGVWYAADMCILNHKTIAYLKTSKYRTRTCVWTDLGTYRALSADLKNEIAGIKIFTDGALGARSGALKEGFIPRGTGKLLHSDEELLNLLHSVIMIDKPVAIHALGDMALEQVANVFKRVVSGGKSLKARVEHCQFISKKVAMELKTCGATLSMQPNFSYDSVLFTDRLSKKYLEQNNPFRMLIDEVGFVPGIDLIFGSDGMPHGVRFALEQSLFPPYDRQRLQLEEFIAGYCMPDEKCGYVEIEINYKAKNVRVKNIVIH